MAVAQPDMAAEVILKLGAEGGEITLVGMKGANGWRFRKITDESTLYDLLSEDDRPSEFRPQDWIDESDWGDSWEELLGRHWHRFVPLEVHPDFRDRVWAAVQRRIPADEDYRLARWQRQCTP
jgi:hypothetical protein